MTETRRQHDLSVTETVEASSVAAGITPGLPPDDPLHAGGETRSQWRDVWRQFRSHKGAVLGMGFLVAVTAFVAVGPWLWPVDPGDLDVRASLLVAAGLTVGAYFGARLNHLLSPVQAKRAFALFLVAVAVRLWVTAKGP